MVGQAVLEAFEAKDMGDDGNLYDRAGRPKQVMKEMEGGEEAIVRSKGGACE